jgi:hypothetical protein
LQEAEQGVILYYCSLVVLGKLVTSSRSHTEDPSRQEAVDNPGRSSPRFMPALDNTEQDCVLNFLPSLDGNWTSSKFVQQMAECGSEKIHLHSLFALKASKNSHKPKPHAHDASTSQG